MKLNDGTGGLSPEDRGEAEKQHSDFLKSFPIEAWPSMTVEEYALGTEFARHSYSYALEWGTSKIGSISGGSALKHVIFRRRSNNEWHYPVGFPDVEQAWTALRGDFMTAIELAQQGRWAEIASVPTLQGATVVTLKTLYLYFPNAMLAVYSKDHLRHFATRLGAEMHDDPVLLNRSILNTLRSTPGVEDLGGLDLAARLYQWAPPAGMSSPTVVKIAPGPGAEKWDDCRGSGYICVGWDDVGDLSLFETEEDFRTTFAAAYPYNGNRSQITRKAKELWTLTSLRAGDKVIANRGTSEVLGVGTVKDSAYEWRSDRTDYQHTVAVDWDTSVARRLDEPIKRWATTTVLPVPKSVASRLLKPATVQSPTSSDVSLASLYEAPYEDWARILKRKKQIIFYGPPGTGKTHAARGFTRWLLARELGFNESSLDSLESLDQYLTSQGVAEHAWWVSDSPQNGTWDDLFADGHARLQLGHTANNYASVRSGDLVICYESAPTSRVVALARVVANHADDPDDEAPLRLRLVGRAPGGATWQAMKTAPLLQDSAPVRAGGSGSLFALTAEEWKSICVLSDVRALALGDVAFDLAGYLTSLTFHASYSYEEFVEGYRPVHGSSGLALELRDGVLKRVAATAAADDPSPYVLLLDEINRANVPRVFGELLTVIEADKRGMEVTLPASGDRLSIPGNLYLVGTMNTSDQSIRTLDAALRRRFAFIELMPQPELLNGAAVEGLELDTFLRELNRRITKRAGRERQIGHSFFLEGGEPIQDKETLADVIRLEIVPLLQEVAFDDYGQLADYLGRELIDPDGQRLTSVVDDDAALIAALAKEYAGSVDPGD